MDKHFICTTDPDTAKMLKKLGYEELPRQGNRWMFLNNKSIVFSSDNMKLHYTNNLSI